MVLSVIISTLNRLILLKQTLSSLLKNSDNKLDIIVVDDGSNDGTQRFLSRQKGINYYCFNERVTIAEVKEKGFSLSSSQDYIYFSDDDVYFEPHWDTKLIEVLGNYPDIGIIGGKHHSHHKIFASRSFKEGNILICEQQAGYSLMLRRKDYKAVNGYEVSPRTEDGGEDTLLCDMIKEKGMLVGSLEPPVIIHCGMKNFRGLLASDYSEMRYIKSQRPEIIFR